MSERDPDDGGDSDPEIAVGTGRDVERGEDVETGGDGSEADADDSGETEPSPGTGATGSSPEAAEESLPELVPYSAVQLVVAITVVGVAIRFVGLGARPMHFDEARVLYWSMHYRETGSLTYRAIVHGPFVQLVSAGLFDLFGVNDFMGRFPVALIGGLLPATALLYREHLRKSELVALALFLAFNAIFVYYSRFLRSDMLLATFMFGGFGMVVRYYDTRRIGYLYGAGVLVALGLTTKENGLIYLLTWAGATVLLVDHSLFPPRPFESGFDRVKHSRVGRFLGDALTVALIPFKGLGVARERFEDPVTVRNTVLRISGHFLLAGLATAAVLVFFYADRGAGMAGLIQSSTPPSAGDEGLWEALGQPLQFPGYAWDTLQAAYSEALAQWGGAGEVGEETSFLEKYKTTLVEKELANIRDHAPAIGALAVFGFVWERYARSDPRNLVMFMAYCAGASVMGYSLKDDPGSGYWLTAHLVLPMTIPAAVGASRLYRWAIDRQDRHDFFATFFALLILSSLGATSAMATIDTSYQNPTAKENGLVQFAQADAEFSDAATAIEAVSDGNGTDVVLYHSQDHVTGRGLVGPSDGWYREPACAGNQWISTLPMPWYFAKANTSVDCERNQTAFADQVRTGQPPMVVTLADDPNVPRELLETNYSSRSFDLYRGAHRVTIYVHEDHVDEAPGWE